MGHVRSFTGFPALPELQAFLAAKDTPFATSQLYSSEQDAKIVDLELRKSRFRTFQDRKIFDLVDQTVQWLNKSDREYSYQLRCDDITETRYEKEGHFLKHKDYLSVTSNLVEEFTLILCVTPEPLGNVDGGETLIYPYASRKGVAFDTTTPGNGLLFRKDLEHAGNVLKEGEKHILTANLWATRKQASDQVLFVTFPKVEDHNDDKAEASLRKVANQDTSYALPVDCLKGTMLDAHVRFVNQGYEQNDQDLPSVVTYMCSDFSFQEFGTVAKILQRSYVDENSISRHATCLDFFGPFQNENLLVNLSLERKPVDPQATCQRFVQPDKLDDGESPAKKVPTKKFKTNGDDAPGAEDLDVIVCENESRAQVVNEVARQLGFHDYVPFKMLFVQGLIETLGNYTNVPVTPVALLLGDYNHIFAIRRCGGNVGMDACTLNEFHTKRNYWDDPNPEGWDADFGLFGDDQYEEEHDFYSKGRGLGLKFALGKDQARDKLTRYVFENPDHGLSISTRAFLPLSHFSGSESDDSSESEGEDASTTSLFHRDKSGKATFTWKEADAASNLIASMDLDERVKACIQKKRFELPQECEEMDEYYCNDSVYANLNILFVTGVVRLHPSAVAASTSVASTTQNFDAWPSESQKRDTRRKRSEHWGRMGLDFGDY